MAFEQIIKDAIKESENGIRKGDKLEEITEIQDYIKNAKKIYIPNKNGIKVDVINNVLTEYNIAKAEILDINTNQADASRSPAIFKGLMAIDMCDGDLIIARGRLGIPGSGSLLVFLDNKGRILTGAMSASHVVHQKSLKEAVRDECIEALKRIGF